MMFQEGKNALDISTMNESDNELLLKNIRFFDRECKFIILIRHHQIHVIT